ncbi:MAG: DUF1848 domain-containing protein [Candidatus Aminicenantes bacterium]|nr:DUF1848 domain-containing protein [Candidatus Aminicenantes bacterium]
MIISASRRTDIPAYFAGEFMAGIRAGFIDVPHPRDPHKTSRVLLSPENVEAIVFWTRDPRPLLPHFRELDDRGYFFYFQCTLLDGPPCFDPEGPRGKEAIAAFRELAGTIGPDRVVWRYDPIVLSGRTGPAYHREKFEALADALTGATKRVMISLVDFYRSVVPRLRLLEKKDIVVRPPAPEDLEELIPALVETAAAHGLEISSCAEEIDLAAWGVRPGKCIDDELLSRLLGRRLRVRKDPRQRKACGCVESRDIGVYGTCRRGCVYCYAGGGTRPVTPPL